jgi:hypothetical protein
MHASNTCIASNTCTILHFFKTLGSNGPFHNCRIFAACFSLALRTPAHRFAWQIARTAAAIHERTMPVYSANKVAATDQPPLLVKQPSRVRRITSSSDGNSSFASNINSGSIQKQSSQSKLLSARRPAVKMKARTLLYVIFAMVSMN